MPVITRAGKKSASGNQTPATKRPQKKPTQAQELSEEGPVAAYPHVDEGKALHNTALPGSGPKGIIPSSSHHQESPGTVAADIGEQGANDKVTNDQSTIDQSTNNQSTTNQTSTNRAIHEELILLAVLIILLFASIGLAVNLRHSATDSNDPPQEPERHDKKEIQAPFWNREQRRIEWRDV